MRHLGLLFLSFLFAFSLQGADFREVYELSLKKDEQKKFLVKYGKYERLFTFRWTLYVNDGLVVLHSYDRAVGQTVLYAKNKNSAFRVMLQSKGIDTRFRPYFLVMFKEFDYVTNSAKFDIMLWDEKMSVDIQELKNG